MSEVQQLIPHRPPFLFVDEIIDSDADHLTAKKVVPKDADFFAGIIRIIPSCRVC